MKKLVFLLILLFPLVGFAQMTDRGATLPTACTYGSPPCGPPPYPDTTGYVNRTVCPSGCDYPTLQQALDDIHNVGGDTAGEVIKLTNSTTYSFAGSVTLPGYTITAGKWIILAIDNQGLLPAYLERVDPSYDSVLPTLQFSSTLGFITVMNAKPNHYWFTGLKVMPSASSSVLYNEFSLGASETSEANLPTYFVFDRCHLTGSLTSTDGSKDFRRGVGVGANYVSFIGSYLDGFQSNSSDAQAVNPVNTTGPLLFYNTHLEAQAEDLMLGASGDPAISGAIPSDITIKRCTFTKTLSWIGTTLAGQFKNLFETKNARRVLLEGNIFENSYGGNQPGYWLTLSPRNYGQTCPQCTSEDIVARYNIVRHLGAGAEITGGDSEYNGDPTSQPCSHIVIHDNLIYDLNGATWNGDGWFLNLVNSTVVPYAHDIVVDHNTVFHTYDIALLRVNTTTFHNFTYTNNIQPHNAYGIMGESSSPGTIALNQYCDSDYLVTANVIEDITSAGLSCSNYPNGNFCPDAWSDLNFENVTICTDPDMTTAQIGACKIQSGTTYAAGGSGEATDGLDQGANIDAILLALSGGEPSSSSVSSGGTRSGGTIQ